MCEYIFLNQLGVGETATVVYVDDSSALKKRLGEIGFSSGSVVKCIMKSPLGDPKAFLVKGSVIALRSEDARAVIASRGGVVWD